MATINPSLKRYQTLRQRFNELPADSNGERMNLQPMDVVELGGHINQASRTDNDPGTYDIIKFSSQQNKGNFRSEAFVEVPAPRGFWGGRQGNETLVHLSRQVSHTAGGYGLTDVVLRTIDLVTGETLSESKGNKAIKDSQKLGNQIPFRLHYTKPTA